MDESRTTAAAWPALSRRGFIGALSLLAASSHAVPAVESERFRWRRQLAGRSVARGESNYESWRRAMPWQMFTGLREQISPTILAVATILVLISIALLTTVELLRRRSERLRGLSPG